MKKASTLTLRLSAEEAAQLEILKEITKCKTGSEALKHVMREYPRFVLHYRKQAEESKRKEAQQRAQAEELRQVAAAMEVLARFAAKER